MRAIIGGLGGMIAGWVGWWLGSKIGLGTAVVLSAIAGPFGFYFGRRWFDDNLG